MTGHEDPYRWLEGTSPAASDWQAAQNLRTSEALARIPWRDAVEREMRVSVDRMNVAAPQPAGGLWYRLEVDADGRRVVATQDPLDDGGTVVVAADAFADEGAEVALGAFSPAPDGRHIACTLVRPSTSHPGARELGVYVVEAATGRVLEQHVRFASTMLLSWLPDGSGFFVSAADEPEIGSTDKHLVRYEIGGEVAREPLTGDPGVAIREQYTLCPQVSADGRHVAAITSLLDPRPEYVRRLPDGSWEPFLNDVEGRAAGFFAGDEYVAISTHRAPRGRLVSIPLASAGQTETWTELVPESDAVLWTVQQAGDRLALTRLRGRAVEVALVDRDGRELDQVPLPEPGSVHSDGHTSFGLAASASHAGPLLQTDSEGLVFTFSSPTRAPSLHHHRLASGELRGSFCDPDERLEVEEHASPRGDGTVVESTIVRRVDLDAGVPQPTLIYAYGACNVAFVPGWLGVLAPFVAAGGVLVAARLRGGGELGDLHWRDGRRACKQHTVDDLHAVAETLIAEGRTDSDRLAVVGASAGGLLTATALTQRPELYGAAAVLVPLTDLLRMGTSPHSRVSDDEFGDPDDAAAARWLSAYSPYQHVPEGRHPQTIVWAAERDTRCPAWHSRKFVARLQERSSDPSRVLLRIAPTANHDAPVQDPAAAADWMTWIMDAVRLSPETHQPVVVDER